MNNKMAINTYLLTFDSKKKKAKQNLRHREHFDGYQMGGKLGG